MAVELTGFSELIADLAGMAADLDNGPGVDRALQAGAVPVEQQMLANASSDPKIITGALHGSIHTSKVKARGGGGKHVTIGVHVKEKSAYYVDEATIYAAVDEVLEQITTDEMTDREKVEAVYQWITWNFSYYGDSDKTDWLQAAYSMMTRRCGDCFNFYALSKLMFDRLGIPNITVVRSENPYRQTSHYWSLVSVDGGETYYHFDTTPHSAGYGYRFCLVTDEYLDFYSEKVVLGYYSRDTSLYPATPTEPLE